MRIIRHVVGAAVAAALATAAVPAQAQFINILTGGQTGVYFPLGTAMSKIYADNIPGARPTVQATQASVQNLNLLQEGKGEIALTLGDSLGFAWEGNEEAGFKTPLKKLRGIAAVYPNFIQLVATKDSGIKTIADLKVEYLDFAQSIELMKNRQLDATLQSAGLGVASIRDLASSNDITVISVPADVVAKIGAPYVPVIIPADTYKGQTAAVPTAAVVNFLVTHEGVPEPLIYQMTKSLYDNLPAMVAAHAAARDIKLEAALQGMPIPLHPGAERFLKEKGVMK